MLAGKWLGSMSAAEAARDLLDNTDVQQQRQVLTRLKPHRAAALLEVRACNPARLLPSQQHRGLYTLGAMSCIALLVAVGLR